MIRIAVFVALSLAAFGSACSSADPATADDETAPGELTEPPSEEAPSSDETDGEAARSCNWRLEEEPEEQLVRLGPNGEPNREGKPMNEVDLDGKPPVDVIGYLGMCGNWGDCVYVVLRACEDGNYEAVWGPDYAQGVDLGERPKDAQMANLVVHGRTGSAGCDLPLQTTLAWTGDGWEQIEHCAGNGIWDESCGTRPPSCE